MNKKPRLDNRRRTPDHGNKRGKLTDRQKAFVLAYIACNSAEQAAREVGYSAKTKYGGVLMAMPLVKAEIEKMRAKMLGKLQLNAEAVLTDIHRNAKKAELAGEFNAAIRGHELLGKHLKLFTEKHEHGGIGGGPIPLSITETEAKL
jgi:phage terminase small subunit